MAQITLRDVKASALKCSKQLEELGYIVPRITKYRISPRMTRAFGNCATRANWLGEKSMVTISISKDLPLHLLDNTMIHEQIHAVLPVKVGHGYAFQSLARKVNVKFGYNVSTYASREETNEVNAHRVVSGSKVTVNCSCGKQVITTKIKANRVISNPFNYRCNGCGKSGNFTRG